MIQKKFMWFSKKVSEFSTSQRVPILWMVLFVGFVGVCLHDFQLHRELNAVKGKYQQSLTLVDQVRELEAHLQYMGEKLNALSKMSAKFQMIANIQQAMEADLAYVNHPQPFERKRVFQPDLHPIIPLSEKLDLESFQVKILDLKANLDDEAERHEELEDFFESNSTFLSAIPSLLPSPGRISSPFGFRRGPAGRWRVHEGVDIAANYGERVTAAASGVVDEAGFSPGYGRYVIVNHGAGLKTLYGHASRLWVRPGDIVQRGEKIASVGRSGRARGTHLHYEVRLNDVPLDPKNFLF